MEKIRVYPDKVVHSAESIYNAKVFLDIAKQAENDPNPVFKLEQPWGTLFLEVDKLKENPKITMQGNQEFNSYWEKLKFKVGKYGSHIRILTSLIFLFAMFYLFYIAFNLISDRKGVNLLLAFLVMVLLEMSFMLMIIYKNKTDVYPTMSQFLSTYSHLLYLIVFTIIIFLTFAIFNMQEASQIMMNMFYTLILGSLIFIFIFNIFIYQSKCLELTQYLQHQNHFFSQF